MAADQARQEFVDGPKIDAPALEGARIVLTIYTNEVGECWDGKGFPSTTVVTGPGGSYDLELVFGSMVWDPDNTILLCVKHSAYSSYEYRAVYEKTPRPEKNGSRFLNIYLRKKSR